MIKEDKIITFTKYIMLFHSMLIAYAILVPTLYRNCESRLHGFRQHCMACWKFYFFTYCLTKSLTGCCVEWQAADNFIYFFDVKDLIYTFKWHSLNCQNFSLKCSLKPLEQHCIGPRLDKLLTFNGTFSLCKVVWSLLGNIA